MKHQSFGWPINREGSDIPPSLGWKGINGRKALPLDAVIDRPDMNIFILQQKGFPLYSGVCWKVLWMFIKITVPLSMLHIMNIHHVYIYIYMCVCVFLCICIYICKYILYIYMYIWYYAIIILILVLILAIIVVIIVVIIWIVMIITTVALCNYIYRSCVYAFVHITWRIMTDTPRGCNFMQPWDPLLCQVFSTWLRAQCPRERTSAGPSWIKIHLHSARYVCVCGWYLLAGLFKDHSRYHHAILCKP